MDTDGPPKNLFEMKDVSLSRLGSMFSDESI